MKRKEQLKIEYKWRMWNHDVDTLLHEMVKNPALVDIAPPDLVGRAEAFADALHAMQARRRPEGVDNDGWGRPRRHRVYVRRAKAKAKEKTKAKKSKAG